MIFNDGSVSGVQGVPFGLGVWFSAPQSKYDFWQVFPELDDSYNGTQYKSLFESGMSSPTNTYKLVYERSDVVTSKKGEPLHWKMYHLCFSSLSDEECLKNNVVWEVVDGDLYKIFPVDLNPS